jgi:putative DNA primase/helicase
VSADLFANTKLIPTADVFRAFFPSIELKRDGTNRAAARCIFHEENTASLKIFQNGFKCFGCSAHGSNIDLIIQAKLATEPIEAAKLITEKLGINIKESRKKKRVTLAQYSRYLHVPVDFLTAAFYLEEEDGLVLIPYLDESKNLISVQARTQLEKSKTGADKRFFWKQGKPYLYGAWRLPEWRDAGVTRLWICEGASDVQVSVFNDVRAIGAPGADTFKPEWGAMLLHSRRLLLFRNRARAATLSSRK